MRLFPKIGFLLLFTSLLALFFPLQVDAQQPASLKFETLEIDLGTVSEEGESPVALFRFTNVSGKPVVITNVATSCGCTVAEYTTEPLAAGKGGFVKLTYNPKGRVGAILRSVQVFTSNNEKPYRLLIKGDVKAGEPRKFRAYPYVSGNLQMRNQTVRFGAMRGHEQLQEILVVNQGSAPLRVTIRSPYPYMKGVLNPKQLKPDEKGVIELIRSEKGCPNPGEEEVFTLEKNEHSTQSHLVLDLKLKK